LLQLLSDEIFSLKKKKEKKKEKSLIFKAFTMKHVDHQKKKVEKGKYKYKKIRRQLVSLGKKINER